MALHQIKNVFINSVFPNEEQAKDFQEKVGSFVEGSWQQSLAAWLDDFCPPDQYLEIDRLDLEVHFDGSTFNMMHWNDMVIKLLKERLQDELALKTYDTNESVSIVSAQGSWLAKIIFFWKTGNLPWNARSADFTAPITRETIDKCHDEIIERREVLLKLLIGKSFFLRCYTSMREAAFVAFISLLRPDIMNLSDYFLVAKLTYKLMMPRETMPRDIAIRMAEFWSWIVGPKSANMQLSSKIALGFLFIQWQSSSGRKLDSESGAATARQTFSDFLQKLLVLSENKLPDGWNKTIRRMASEKDSSFRSSIARAIEQDISLLASADNQTSNQDPGNEIEFLIIQKEKQDWLVEGAGVVLLHPFIQVLFDEFGISRKDAGGLLLPDLAVQALHYLIFGNTQFQPHRLAAIRCLCGLDDNFVVQEVDFPPELKAECDQLLSSVIRHWKVLKKTSVEGLRVSFLQRMGLISEVDDHYKLKVEKQSYDLLLDHLPWSYSIVKLPWMLKPMYVQWHNSM